MATLDMSGSVGRCPEDGALLVRRPLLLHTIAKHSGVEVAFCDHDLEVIATVWLRPWRVARPRLRARHVLLARAGAFERWRLSTGDRLEIKGT